MTFMPMMDVKVYPQVVSKKKNNLNVIYHVKYVLVIIIIIKMF